MKHLHAIGISIFLLFTFNSKIQSQKFNRSAMPFDMVFVGFDNDIGGVTSEKIALLTTVDIYSGYTFGLINKLKDDEDWIAYNNDELVQISFKVKSGFSFRRGTLLEIKLLDGQISIFSDDINITTQFEINGLKDSSYQFLKSTGSFLTVHSGYFITNQNEFLLGTVLDIISIGVARSELLDLQLPKALIPKDIFTTIGPHDDGGHIDFHNCNLCDIILIILNPDNWNFIQGTSLDDIDLSDFNIEDCAEVDCQGELLLDLIDCEILVEKNPCDSLPASYKWQVLDDGIYVTLLSGNNEEVPPFVISVEEQDDQQYRLVVECSDGCIYTKDTLVNCIIPDCTVSLDVDTIGCLLTATVSDCENPIFNWINIYMGSYSQAGNTPSITAENDGEYYVMITGCCEDKTSDYFNMDGCLDCECSQVLDTNECTILVTEDGCIGYVDTWQYSETGVDSTWQTINYHGLEYETTKNGFYRRILFKEGCEEISNVIEVNCSMDCAEFEASAMINSECNIVIDYTGCSAVTSIGISYNSDFPASECNSASNNGYFFGGGTVLENNDNGLSGEIIISPDNETSCYQISLTCENGCVLFVYIYNPICCEDSLAITVDDCFAVPDGIPCTGVFSYYWIINNSIQSTESGETVPPLPILENGTYQLVVLCSDSCEYYSNEIFEDCFDPQCESSVMIEPEGCLMVADIVNCPDAIIQWQKWNGTEFEDIIGENEPSYLATSDEPIKVLITNCENCEDEEPLSFEYTPMGCDDMCDCIVDVTLDDETCVINSTDTDCSNVQISLWEQSNDDGVTWFFVAYATSGGSYTPMDNAWYRKINYFNDGCDTIYDIAIVECLEDCDPSLTITLSITDDCYLKAEWVGCASYVSEGFGWYFSENSEENCPINSDFPLTSDQVTDIIEIENNPANQSGYIIVNAEFGKGCYFFNFQCEGCIVDQEAIWWEPCCDDEPEIVSITIENDICDYCWWNEDTEQLLEIEVELPNGSLLNLSTEPEFDFPYCLPGECSNSYADLVAALNLWLNNNGYQGQAGIGPNVSSVLCKNNGLFHINSSDVKFINGTFIQNGNNLMYEFDETNCLIQSEYFLTVDYECDDATYLWSTGETSDTIEVEEYFDPDIMVMVTCPDGCVYDSIQVLPQPLIANEDIELFHLDNNVLSTSEITLNPNNSKPSIQIYPNPTRNEFYIEINNKDAKYIGLKMYNSQGQLVKEKSIRERDDNRYLIDTETMQPGMYYIWIAADKETIGYKKLIVIK